MSMRCHDIPGEPYVVEDEEVAWGYQEAFYRTLQVGKHREVLVGKLQVDHKVVGGRRLDLQEHEVLVGNQVVLLVQVVLKWIN